MKLTIKDNKVTMEFPKSLRTKAQENTLKNLIKTQSINAAVDYLKTFNTKPSRSADVIYNVRSAKPSIKNVIDKLGEKQKGSTLLAFKKMLSTTESHYPTGPYTAWFGVEIECCIPYSSLDVSGSRECPGCPGTGENTYENDDGEEVTVECPVCEGSGEIDCEDSMHDHARKALKNLVEARKIKRVSIKSDGSIETDGDSLAIELAVLTKIDDTENLAKLCALLNELGASVNKSCGLHIHLDARHLSESEVELRGKRLGRALPVLAAMVPKARRENTYCRLQVSNKDRYSAINLCAYRKFKTIEVRLHSGTTNFKKILSWAKIISTIAQSDVRKVVNSINELTEFARIEENLVEYMTQRTALFQGEAVQIEFTDMDESEAS